MLTFLHFMMTMRFICQEASSGACTRAYNCADRAANFRSDQCTANRAATDELCLGVMVGVVAMCLGDGVFVGFLSEGRDRPCENSGRDDGCCEDVTFHLIPPATVSCRRL